MNSHDLIIGVNAYGLRYLFADGVMETITLIKAKGLNALEPMVIVDDKPLNSNKYPNAIWDRDFLLENHKTIEEAGVYIPSIHCFVSDLSDPEQVGKNIIDINERTGIKYFVFTDYTLKTADQVEKLSVFFNRVIQFANKKMMILYHPHENEFIKIDGGYLIDTLLEKCPKLMIQADMGWIKFAGVDPLKYMLSVKDRVKMWHFKDLIPEFCPEIRKTSFTAVGKGIVGYDKIISHMRDFDLNDYCLIICQDNSNEDLLVDLERGADFIREEIKKYNE